jgi:hypothetical protein
MQGAKSSVSLAACISSPIASPTAYSRSRSKAAPRAMLTGNAVEKPTLAPPTLAADGNTPKKSSPRFMPREASRYRKPRIVFVSSLCWMLL